MNVIVTFCATCVAMGYACCLLIFLQVVAAPDNLYKKSAFALACTTKLTANEESLYR